MSQIAGQWVVILVVGRPASGKSTLAEVISSTWGRAAFALLDQVIDLQLRSGESFVVDAAYDAAFENSKWQLRQREHGFVAVQIHCTAPVAELVRRMSQRAETEGRHPGHADVSRLDEFRALLSDGRLQQEALHGNTCEPTAELVLEGRSRVALKGSPRTQSYARFTCRH